MPKRVDDLRDMLAACSENQKGFRLRARPVHLGISMTERNVLGEWGSAWFSGLQGDISFAPEKLAEESGLGRFSAPFDPSSVMNSPRGVPSALAKFGPKSMEPEGRNPIPSD